MEYQTALAAPGLYPVMLGAPATVIPVSLLGAVALTGLAIRSAGAMVGR